MNRDQKLLEEAYRVILEDASELADTLEYIKNYIRRGSVGNLTLQRSPITYLPPELKTVRGNLDLYESEILALPDNFEVHGNLLASFTKLETLPKNLKVQGDLDLRVCYITFIPADLEVHGNLDLSYSPIESLPKNFTVGGLRLRNCPKITSLPENLTIQGSLHLDNTNIKSLPDSLTVEGVLCLKGSGITKVSQLPLHLNPIAIDSYDFDEEDFMKYKQIHSKLSNTFSDEELKTFDDF